jgi:hypothetical protein
VEVEDEVSNGESCEDHVSLSLQLDRLCSGHSLRTSIELLLHSKFCKSKFSVLAQVLMMHTWFHMFVARSHILQFDLVTVAGDTSSELKEKCQPNVQKEFGLHCQCGLYLKQPLTPADCTSNHRLPIETGRWTHSPIPKDMLLQYS